MLAVKRGKHVEQLKQLSPDATKILHDKAHPQTPDSTVYSADTGHVRFHCRKRKLRKITQYYNNAQDHSIL